MPRIRPALLVLGLGIAAGPAGAAPVAGSAASASLAMPGEFLEAPYLLHQHPQLNALVPSQLAVTNTVSFGSPGAIRAVLRSGNSSFFLLSQPYTLQTVRLSSNLVHLGFATRGGPLRLGLAVRGTTARNDDERIDDSLIDDTRDRSSLDERRSSYLEGALGAGIGGNETFLDLTFETYREDFESHSRNYDPPDSVDLDVDARPRFRFGGSGRAGFPGPFGTRMQLVGTFQDRTTRVDVARLGTDTLSIDRRDEDYGHLWEAGLAASKDVQEAVVSFHALYRNESGPTERYSTSTLYIVDDRTSQLENVTFGLALRRPFWWETTLLVGLRNEFVLQKVRAHRETTDGRIDIDENTDEYLSQGFGWGLRRSFDNFDLTGSLRTNIPAGDLFGTLDAVFRL